MVGLKFAVSLSSSIVTVLLVVLVIAVAVQTEVSKAQSTCSTSLGNLNRCAPFVVPGTTPSSDCCDALAAASHDCICTTLSIVAHLLSLYNLPPVNCLNLPNLI